MSESLVLGIVLGVTFLFIVLMLSGKFSFAWIGFTCLSILVLTGASTIKEAMSGFYDKNVLMMAGMFAIAGLLGRTNFTEKIKTALLSGKESGSNDLKIVFMLMVIAAVLAQFMTSQSSIIMIMMSFMMGICEESKEVKLSRILLPLTFIMTSFMGKFPVGSTGVTTYLMLNQFIEATGETRLLDLLSMMRCTWLPGIAGLVYCAFSYKMLPKKEVDLAAFQGTKKNDESVMPIEKQRIVYIGFVVSIAGLFLAPSIGERAYFIPLAVCMLMILLKVMDGKYFLNALMQGPVLMCATIMGIANILTASGAGNVIGNLVLTLLGGNPSGIMIVTVFAFITVLTTSFISNTATFMVLIPIACNVCAAAGIDPRATVVAIFSSSLLSVMTPMANTGSAICYSACNLNVRETFKWAFPASLIGVVLTIINCIMVYPVS